MSHGAATTRLVCHAKASDPRRRGQNCGGLVGMAAGAFAFVAAVDALPDAIEPGVIVGRCSRSACRKWNVYVEVQAVEVVA